MRAATVTGSARLPCEVQGTVWNGSGARSLPQNRKEKKHRLSIHWVGRAARTVFPQKGVYRTTVERPLVSGWEIVTSEREAL